MTIVVPTLFVETSYIEHDGDTGDGDTVENTASGCAKLPAEPPKGEANLLKSWGRRGETLASSRLRDVRARVDDRLEAESDALAPLVVVLEEDSRQEQEKKTEMGLGGYDYDELTDSLVSRPAEFDMQDSAYNVLSLMNSMDDTPGNFALVIEGQEGESELESDSKCLLVQCLKRRFPRYQ